MLLYIIIQGKFSNAGRKAPDFVFKSVNIWDRKMFYTSFGKLEASVFTVNSRFKKDLKLQIHIHKAFF